MLIQKKGGPRIIFEKNGSFVFASPREVHSFFKPKGGESALQKFRDNFAKYWVTLEKNDE